MDNEAAGRKYDADKLKWHLLKLKWLEPVVRVFMFGAKKYAPFNWQLVVKGDPTRYIDALKRHLADYEEGERTEPESGQPTMAHLICCGIFLLWHDNEVK
jgi:hypothetical protein